MEEEELDMNVVRAPYLICNMIDVTWTKALDTSHRPVLSAQERHARDDIVMAHMFGMVELQLRIRGCPIMDNEMETLAERYPLTESATYICRIGPTFQEPLDNEEANVDEEMDGEEEDDDVDEDANALMRRAPRAKLQKPKPALQRNLPGALPGAARHVQTTEAVAWHDGRHEAPCLFQLFQQK
ncbi:hypothetical protein H5410_036000 [Solanum commersonii]|uniref:Uncharacterized protein n=1 Tax=Solanum commersonii TaxID=4109 RepID=A0A9J5Y591_SOLCO|nr:hypothetical protein H5410_036000 [Solanum commersonii]